MKWNYILGACVLVLVYSVYTGSALPALFGAIALVTAVKLGSRQLLRRLVSKKWSPHPSQRSSNTKA
jgi:hypothetical protein